MKEEMRKRKEEEGKLTVYSYLKNKKKEMNNAWINNVSPWIYII